MKVTERCVIEVEVTQQEYKNIKSRAKKEHKDCAAFAHDAVVFFLGKSVPTPKP